jgi:hypothetical protein
MSNLQPTIFFLSQTNQGQSASLKICIETVGIYLGPVWHSSLKCLSSGFSVFFCEALPNTFLENSFTREAPEGRIRFFYYRGEAKKWLLQLLK